MKSLLGGALLLALAACLPAQPAVPALTNAILLTNIQQVATLDSSVLVSNRYEARVEGVIIYVSIGPRIYIQEGERALLVGLAGSSRDYRMGQRVQVTGTVTPGPPFPGVDGAKVSVLGEAPLPEAPFISPHRLIAGEESYRYVTTRGVVRDMTATRSGLTLLVSYEGAMFEIIIPADSMQPLLPRHWLDAEIEVRGKNFPFFNRSGKVSGIRFHAQSTNFVRVLKPGSGTLFERPLLTVAEAAAKPQDWIPRYRFSGTVTLHKSGVVYVDDGTGVMLAVQLVPLARPAGTDGLEHEPQTPLEPGERVEIIGARHNGYSHIPTMIFAEYRRVGQAPLPPAIPIKLHDLQAARHPGKIVSLEAKLLNQRGWSAAGGYNNQSLMFQAGEGLVEANWTGEGSPTWSFKPDTYYRVTGVHDSEGGLVKGRPSFQLLLRSPEDLASIAAPPFWMEPKIWKPSVAAGGVSLLAAGWIFLLRRQVNRRTAQLRVTNLDLKDEVADRKRAEQVQRAIYEISEAVRGEQDLPGFYARIHQVVGGLMPADNFFLLLHNRDTGLHEYVYHVDQKDAWPAARKVFAGLVGYILRHGCSLLVDRESMSNPANEWHFVSGTASAVWLGVPLVSHGQTIGVMAVQDYDNPDAYGKPEQEILTYMAGQTALAIERKHSDAALAESQSRLRESLAEVGRSLDQERELNQLKSTFVSMVSHEFRTPLEVILSSSNILDRYLERLSPDQRTTQLRAIRKSVHRMNDLIDDVLLLGKFDAGALACCPMPMDLGAFCRRVANEISSASAREGVIKVSVEGLDGEAAADEGLLHHILGNLLSNAVKYSPPDRDVELLVTRAGVDAQFTVRDQGCGIPASDQARLFTAFYRGSNVGQTPGSGLGLVITKRCVDLHNGTITCTSEQGVGTTFIVTLPLFDGTRIFRRRPTSALRADGFAKN